jgi:general stress protein YciG
MPNNGQQDQKHTEQPGPKPEPMEGRSETGHLPAEQPQGNVPVAQGTAPGPGVGLGPEGRPVERKTPGRTGARGTAAMDPQTRKEVARKGGQAVSRNRQHMAEIGRKGGQSVSKNREHMAKIGRKGGAASRGHH